MLTSYEDVERALEGVPGVAAASVGAGSAPGRGKLRIRLAAGHDADEVSHAVSELLRQRFGIDIAPSDIQPRTDVDVTEDGHEQEAVAVDDAQEQPPAPVDDAQEQPPAPVDDAEEQRDATSQDIHQEPTADATVEDTPQEPTADATAEDTPQELTAASNGSSNGHRSRAAIRDLLIAVDGLEVSAVTVLDLDGTEVRGEATGAATDGASARAVARSTLAAVDHLVPGRAKCDLESVAVHGHGDDRRVTVTVVYLTHEGPERLAGISLVRDGDVDAAIVRATLDAVNRRVADVLEGQSAD